MRVYKLSKEWVLLMCIMVPILILLFGSMLLIPFSTGGHHYFFWIISPFVLGLIVFLTIVLLDAIRGKFVIDHDKVYLQTTLRKKELYLNEIKGYRTTTKYILILSANKEKKSIKISQSFGQKQEIIAWLSHHFPDMDIVDANEEKQAFLNDTSFGSSVEEREEKLKQARKVARVTNGIGILVSIWVVVMGRPYDISIFVLMLIPTLSIGVLKKINGLIRIGQKNRNIYPTIIWNFIYPCMALCLRALLDFEIFQYDNIWLPSIAITVVLLAAILIGNKEFSFRNGRSYFSVLSIAIFLFAHSYGLIVCLNCEYDHSRPQVYVSRILDKHMSSGKSTSYYLKLSPWGPQKETDEIDVTKRFYDKNEINQTVNIHFKKGRLNIPWYIVTNE